MSPYYGSFKSQSESHGSQVTSVGQLDTKKTVETVFIYVFRIAFTASPLKRDNTGLEFQQWTQGFITHLDMAFGAHATPLETEPQGSSSGVTWPSMICLIMNTVQCSLYPGKPVTVLKQPR